MEVTQILALGEMLLPRGSHHIFIPFGRTYSDIYLYFPIVSTSLVSPLYVFPLPVHLSSLRNYFPSHWDLEVCIIVTQQVEPLYMLILSYSSYFTLTTNLLPMAFRRPHIIEV